MDAYSVQWLVCMLGQYCSIAYGVHQYLHLEHVLVQQQHLDCLFSHEIIVLKEFWCVHPWILYIVDKGIEKYNQLFLLCLVFRTDAVRDVSWIMDTPAQVYMSQCLNAKNLHKRLDCSYGWLLRKLFINTLVSYEADRCRIDNFLNYFHQSNKSLVLSAGVSSSVFFQPW